MKKHLRGNSQLATETPRFKPHALKQIGPRVLKLARPYSGVLAIGFVALCLGSGINLLFPYLIRGILNNDFGYQLQEHLGTITLALVGLFALQWVVFFVRHYCFWTAGYKVVADLRTRLFQAIIVQDIAFFDSARVGDLISRLTTDTQAVQSAVTVNISVGVRYLLQVVGGTVLMFVISPTLTVFLIVLLPLIIFASAIWGKRLRKYSRAMQDQLAEASVVSEEAIGAIRTVRMFAGEAYEKSRYAGAIRKALGTGIARTRLAAAFSSTMVFVLHSAIVTVLWFGATLVVKDQISLGDLTAFLLYGVIVAVSFGFLSSVWEEFMHAVGASERIFEVIDSTPRVVSPAHPQSLPRTEVASVHFRNVSFTYPSRADVPVLSELSFDIAAGKTVALVGPSGSGKSTIAALATRFYDPDQGEVLFCGLPLSALNLDELRARISVVPQQPQVFSVSIGKNIAYGRIDASQQEIEDAAKAANIHDFIASLPHGYDTLVGDRGVQLSGGERQRIAIARALLKNPSFLILDEATSSLDSENERLVQQALARLMKNRTSLVIAHRLSTVQHADQVIVLKSGRISQTGTHQSLVDEPGLYRTLVEHQLL